LFDLIQKGLEVGFEKLEAAFFRSFMKEKILRNQLFPTCVGGERKKARKRESEKGKEAAQLFF